MIRLIGHVTPGLVTSALQFDGHEKKLLFLDNEKKAREKLVTVFKKKLVVVFCIAVKDLVFSLI